MDTKNRFVLSREDYGRIFDEMRFAAPAIHAGTDHKQGGSLLFRNHREDFRQMVCEVSLMAERDGLTYETDRQFHGYFRSYFYRQLRNYGFTREFDDTGECCGGWVTKDVGGFTHERPVDPHDRKYRREGKVYPTCGLPGCTARKVYNDERYGALCRKHGGLVVKRRERNWPDPYLGIETAKVQVGAKYLPKENRKFWTLVRMFVSDEEWIAMWEWAKGRARRIDDKILAKAREAITVAEQG